MIQPTRLPQVVPNRVCLTCAVCCRFPEADSFLRPYFTDEEIRRAAELGLDPAHFPDPRGSQVQVVPHPFGDGFLCPAFDPATSQCRIYEGRPLDCQIYPLSVMWSADQTRVVLGWDTKCPFMLQNDGGGAFEVRRSTLPENSEPRTLNLEPVFETYAERIAALLETDEMVKTFAAHPGLVGRFQAEVVILRPLPRLTKALEVKGEALLLPPHPTLKPLTLADRARLEQAMAEFDTPLAAFAYAPHAVWRTLFSYWLAELSGYLCLFAEYGDGLFMPLPPLGPSSDGNRTFSGDAGWASALAQAFAVMRERNRGSGVSRIENVPEEWNPDLVALGYRVTAKDPDYLYRAAELAKLAGDRFKSQRAVYNRFVRTHRFSYHPYRDADEEDCLALYHRWAAQQGARGLDPPARQLLRDAESAHREALARAGELGLTGRVVRVDGELRAYTFGYERSRSVFVVLLEVADRSVPGLAQFIFREFCREAELRGYELVNTMDDSGLQNLARSKMAYRPWRLVPSSIVTQP